MAKTLDSRGDGVKLSEFYITNDMVINFWLVGCVTLYVCCSLVNLSNLKDTRFSRIISAVFFSITWLAITICILWFFVIWLFTEDISYTIELIGSMTKTTKQKNV